MSLAHSQVSNNINQRFVHVKDAVVNSAAFFCENSLRRDRTGMIHSVRWGIINIQI